MTARHLLLFILLSCVGCRCTPKPRTFKRVNDQIGGVLQRLSNDDRFAAVLPADWAIDHLAAPGDRVELGFVDRGGGAHVVELLLESPPKGDVDGQGRFFLYRIKEGGQGNGRAALLAAAGLVDAETPSTAIITLTEKPVEAPPPKTDGQHPVGYFEPGETRTMSRAAALTVGAIESLILALGIVLSVVLPLRRSASAPRADGS